MNINVNISEDVLDNAKFVACKVDDTYLRKRVYALGIAANAAAKYLTENGLKTLSNHSLYKSAVFAKEIEIADIYANNARFDVRVTFNDTTFTVPKLQVKYDIKPEAYIVVRFDNSLKEIEFLGFIPEKELEYTKNGEEYYTYPLDILKPFEDFISYAQALKITPKKYTQEEHENVLALCASIIDEQAAEADKIYFIKHVADCMECRDTFCDINDFDDIVSQLKNYQELLNDSTLSVLSGNKEEVDQAAIAHMALVEKASEDFSKPAPKIETETTPADDKPQEPEVSTAAAAAAGSVLAAASASKISDGMLDMGIINPQQQQSVLAEEENSLSLDDEALSLPELEDESADDLNTLEESNAVSLEEVSESTKETQPAEENNIKDSFDELNASIDAFASEPVEEPFIIEEDEQEILNDTELPQNDEVQSVELNEIADEIPSEIEKETEDLLSTAADDDALTAEDEVLPDLTEAELLSLEEETVSPIPEETQESTTENNLQQEENSLDELQPDTLTVDDETEEISFDEPEENIIENTETEDITFDNDIENLTDIDGLEKFSSEPEDIIEEQTNDTVVAATPLNDIIQEEETDDLQISETNDLEELNDSDSLELEDLETIDSIEPLSSVETEDIKTDDFETITPETTITDETDDLLIEDTEDDWPAVSEPQEPVELKYDDLNDTADEHLSQENSPADSIEADVFDLNKQEPVIESFEDETEQHVADFDFPDYNYESLETTAENSDSQPQTASLPNETPIQNTHQPEQEETAALQNIQKQETNAESENDDLQELLDDDLLALLSDDDEDETGNDKNQEEQVLSSEPFGDEPDAVEMSDEEILPNAEETTPDEQNGDIENLFDDQEAPKEGEQVELDLSQEPMSAEAVKKTKKIAVAGALIALLFIGGAAGGYYMYQKNIAAANNDSMDASQDNQVFDFQNNAASAGEEDTSSGAVSQDINKSMTNSFSDKPAAISITKLSWQVSEKLAVEPSVKEYLQTAGKNIQLNLQNDLANASDVAFNNSVKVTFEIAPDNTLKGIQVLESSGSDKIDAIITKSIKNTLKYVSVPKLKNYNSDYFLTLIINF